MGLADPVVGRPAWMEAAERAREDARRVSGQVVVDGRLTTALTRESFDVESPADLSIIGSAPRCRELDVNRAVASAERAFPAWSDTPALERGRIVARIADRLEAEADRLARLACLETGNAYTTQARPEVGLMIQMTRFYAGLAGELKGKTVPWSGNILHYTTRDPFGVVGAIIPWNAPMFLTACKVAPAIVAGNTVVLKTAEQAPLAVLRAIELMQEFLPPGVVNCISGFGEECGKPLAEHPAVRKVTFTGSCAVGKLIMGYAGQKIAPVTLELGGKSPNVVMPDADLDLAIPGIVMGMRFTRQGQSCTAGTRVFLHEDIYDRVVPRLVAALAQLRVGDPMDDATEMGCIVSREQFERVTRFVDLARRTPGVRIACGGARPADPALQKGYYFAPTLIEDVPHDSPICQEEIFGPVAAVLRFRDFDEMIRLANATEFGLAAGIWTRDLNRALTFAKRVTAGLVQVNQYIGPCPNVAYGGLKHSGIGKELSFEAMLEHFTCSKTVMINAGTPA